ncbi:MAG TPA: 3-keto-5-aminohexanoate cleavage protein [Acidimicrobiia bacterium]|nr:3-keto-5-aminohexanoate cleavage protein [Acidimicrobiia bacterium]
MIPLVSGAIIEVALNGGIPKSLNPHVPRTPDEIVADALACIAAGASIVHNHNDEPTIGGPPAHDPAPYEQVWRAVLAQEPDVMLYPTMRGWGPDTTIEQRYSHVVALAEAGVLGTTIVDLGPINVAPVDSNGLPDPVDVMYLCTFGDIDYEFRVARDIGLPISLAVFEPGHLRAGLAYVKNGFAPPGSMIKFFFESAPVGVAARGLPPTRAALGAYLDMLEGFDLPWMAAVTGAASLDPVFTRLVLEAGGHLSVGIERTGRGGTPRNVELVEQAVELCRSCGRLPLSPAETRSALGLKPALR